MKLLTPSDPHKRLSVHNTPCRFWTRQTTTVWRNLQRHLRFFPMNPLTGIWAPRGNTLGYRYASPCGDGGRGNQHFGARHVSAATPPQCDGATTTLHSPFFTLYPSYTFSAKEKDSETGLSYFGARYYSSDLSIWLSVDPMSGKYPSLSPYVYCADNPVKLVDPNGEEVGDYFSMSGRYLGTDGKNDDKIYFVADRSDKRKIKQNNKAGLTTDIKDVTVKISTTKCAIWATEDVYRRTEKNGGYCEEATSVFPDGLIIDYKRGPDARYTADKKGYVDLPNDYERNGDGILIHSHPLWKYVSYDKSEYRWDVSSKLDADDMEQSFKNAGFIIVGKTMPSDVFEYRRSMAYFFEHGEFKERVSIRAIKRVNKYYE